MITVAGEVVLVNEQVVVTIKLPELAVDDVEVLVAEVLRHLVDVVLHLECLYHLQQV